MKLIKKRGFTLIELLVVVAIISLLASIVLASLSTARAKGRDARRMEDLHQIAIALELYYNSNNNYPKFLYQLTEGGYIANADVLKDPLVQNNLPNSNLLANVPQDPLGSTSYGHPCRPDYCYAFFPKNIDYPTSYVLGATMEIARTPSAVAQTYPNFSNPSLGYDGDSMDQPVISIL